jgi:hypothetical protein
VKNKKIILVVFLLLITLTSFPVFGQENSAAANETEKDPFFSIKTQFSYFPAFVQNNEIVISTEPAYPYGFSPAPGYAIQFGMGLKLFKMVNTFFDFGLNDPAMSKAMNIAGKIGTKYFDVMYTYKITNFPQKTIDVTDVVPADEYDQWYFPQNGRELESKFNVGTLALMSPRFFKAFQAGLIWNSITANLGVQSDKEISGRYIAYLDTDRNFNTYGIRLALDRVALENGTFLSGNEGMGKMKFIYDTYVDMSWGNFTLSKEAADAVGISDGKTGVTYIVVRANYGLGWEKSFSGKMSLNYGLGLDFFSTNINSDASKYGAINDPAAFGIFVRLELIL